MWLQNLLTATSSQLEKTKYVYVCLSKQYITSDCNWTRTQNHLLRKRILNHLAKCLGVQRTTFKALVLVVACAKP